MSLPLRICLCGFMGAGKSAVGEALADELGYVFVDLDSRIAERAGMSIAEIFRSNGEARFRALEEEMGVRALAEERVVIALGGGALTGATLRAAVRDGSCQIYLRARPQVLYERCRTSGGRPIIAGVASLDDFERVYAERMRERCAGYEQAHLTVLTDDLSVEEVVRHICAALNRRPLDA